jgi:hypothetical protein
MNLVKTGQLPVGQVLSFIDSGVMKDDSNIAWFQHNSKSNHRWVTSSDDVKEYQTFRSPVKSTSSKQPLLNISSEMQLS